MTRDIGDVLRILHLNVEATSRPKSDCLLKFANQHCVDVILLQETHCEYEEQVTKSCKLPGYAPAKATFYAKYGIATQDGG